MISVIIPSFAEFNLIDRKHLPEGIHFQRSGIGKINTIHTCNKLFWRDAMVHHFLLIGFCGGNSIPVGTLIEPHKIMQSDFDVCGLEEDKLVIEKAYPKLFTQSRTCTMFSQDTFVDGSDTIPSKGNCVDMESFPFAWFCEQVSLAYSIVKIVSDDTSKYSSKKQFLESCISLKSKLNETLHEAVSLIRCRDEENMGNE